VLKAVQLRKPMQTAMHPIAQNSLLCLLLVLATAPVVCGPMMRVSLVVAMDLIRHCTGPS
jgi:hypothetical protein